MGEGQNLEFVGCKTGIWKRDTYAELGHLE